MIRILLAGAVMGFAALHIVPAKLTAPAPSIDLFIAKPTRPPISVRTEVIVGEIIPLPRRKPE